MKDDNFNNKIIDSMESIKKLLMLLLVLNGAKSDDIGQALGIDSSTVRHMISFRKIKKN